MRKISFIYLFVVFSIPVFAQKTTLPVVTSPKFKKDTLSIKKFGAIADGSFLNTKAINDAIVTLNKKGGGVVLVPSGLWLTGPVALKNNINLHLAVAVS